MLRKNAKWVVAVLILAMASPILFRFASCADSPKEVRTTDAPVTKPLPSVSVPEFNSDTAYAYTEKIVSFGPRVSTGSKGYSMARVWTVEQFKRLGADVIEQHFQAKSYKGKPIAGTNIIARYNPANPTRIVLSVHWDSRDVADQDSTGKDKPIVGADDSGSGMGMLIEIARQLQKTQPNVGVDIVFFDAEDLGEAKSDEIGWCIGSQYWATHPQVPGYKAKYGILLDMAGARGARFAKDAISMQYAPQVAENVWRIGRSLGYVNYFVEEQIGPMIDDHKYVNELAHIPVSYTHLTLPTIYSV